jgi:hypothetical protein
MNFSTMYHLWEIKLHCCGQRSKSGNATDCLPILNNHWHCRHWPDTADIAILRFHFNVSDCIVKLNFHIFRFIDFIILCDIALELSCVVYHSVHFVSSFFLPFFLSLFIVFHFVFKLFSLFFSAIGGGIELCWLICVWIEIFR